MKPRIPCTDPAFKYVDSANTNIAKTFARVKREQAAQAEAEQAAKVQPIRVLRSRGLT